MDLKDIDRLASELHAAPRIKDLPLPSVRHPGLTLDETYAVQRRYAELRAAAGDAVVGRKVAMLGQKRQREVDATEPVTGRMFAGGRLADGGSIGDIAGDRAIVECELAFVLDGEVVSNRPLGGALGDPALVVAWLANRLVPLGEHLRAGDIILTGKIVPDVPATSASTFRAVCGDVGSVSVSGLG